MEIAENTHEEFELRVEIYEELIPYKDYFDVAIHILHRQYAWHTKVCTVNYAPGIDSKMKTQRIKVIYKPKMYLEMYEDLKRLANNNSDRKMVNNILSCLVGFPQYAPKFYHKNK